MATLPAGRRNPTIEPGGPPPPDLLARIGAIVAVRSPETAKSRLGETLDAEERQDVARSLAERAIDAVLRTPEIGLLVVVSDDPGYLALASAAGARAVEDRGEGLNAALERGREVVLGWGGSAVLALPGDLPRITSATLQELIEAARERATATGADSLVALVPDRHGEGTNALVIAPANAIPFAFEHGSRARHAALAAAAGAVYLELAPSALALDVDTPEDLLLVGPDELEAAP